MILTAAASPAQDGVGLPLEAVQFDCDAWIDTDGLRALLPLTPGVPVTSQQLAETRRVLELSQLFLRIDIETHAHDGQAVVILHLERERIITDVTVRGYNELRWREVYRLIRLRTGSFYDPDAIPPARERLVTRYRQAGYPHATVKSRVRTGPGEADVRFTIEEGKPTTILTVAITGDTGVPPDDLENALHDLIGKPNRRDAPRDGERIVLEELRAAGYYDAEVETEFVPSQDDVGVLWFSIQAGTRTEVEFVGNEARGSDQLLGLIDINRRLIITDGTWRELGRRIKRFYQEGGYYQVRVRLRLSEGNPRRVRFTIDEGRPYELRRLRFVGNEQLSSAALGQQMNTQPARWLPWPRPGVFVRAVFDEDLRRLWFFYREQGFDDAEIVDAPVTVDDDTGTIEATVVIDEGPRTVVAEVRPPDLSGLPPDKAALTLKVQPGQPLLPADLEADAKTIQRALRSDGYTDAAVEPVVTRHRSADLAPAVVDWKITRGPRREIGTIVVQGNVETENEPILKQMPFKSGDPLDLDVLQRGQDKVYQLGTYRSVGVRPIGPPAEVQDVGVAVVPRPPGNIQWGAGYNTRDGITGFGELTYDNVAHRARRITLRGQGSIIPDDASQTQFLGILGFREPLFLGTDWVWTSELIGERSTKSIDQFSVLRGSFANGVTRDFLPRLKGGAEVQIERADVFNVQPQSFLSEDQSIQYTTAFSPFLIYDGRNDPFAPISGVFDSLRLRYAPPGISTIQFGKINLQHSQAFPLTDWLSFIYSVRVAYGNAISGGEVLPIRERYFLGGSTTVRGFSENSLGPTDQRFNVLGGDFASVLSFEFRVPIIYQLSLAIFNDNGGLFLTQCDDACRQQHQVHGDALTFANVRHSAGPGLRYMTPIGPISLDFGFKLDRRGEQTIVDTTTGGTNTKSAESIGEVHFSISGTF